jgi:hypothetical protein
MEFFFGSSTKGEPAAEDGIVRDPTEKAGLPYKIKPSHTDKAAPIPVGEVVAFDNANFKGRMLVRVKEDDRFSSYFASKRRLSSVVVTGQFKAQTAIADVLTGQEFQKPLQASSSWYLVNAVIQAFKYVSLVLHVCSNCVAWCIHTSIVCVWLIHSSCDRFIAQICVHSR